MPVTDSSTGEVIAEVPCCTKEEVQQAIDAAKEAYPGWRDTPVLKRAELMFSAKQIFDAHLEELSLLCAKELGKTLDESRGDVLKAIEVFEFASGIPHLMKGESLMNVSNGIDSVMIREPLGVFAGIAPFNFPAMIPFGWMIPLCIASGNTFILKAASMTPLTSMRMLELLIKVGLPKGVVNLVTCSRNEVDLLLSDPAIKGISFVGSTPVGLHVYQTAAAHGKRVQCQTEAKNHALILADAPLERTAAAVINSGFGCAGMRCMALPVVCVEEKVADDFVDILVRLAKARKVGCAYDPETEMGPVVSAEHKQSVLDWIAKGVEEGAQLVLDGRDIRVPGYEGGYFIGPTIFDHVKPGMTVGEREIFGPVVCVKRVQDFEEGLELMNASPFANGSVLFTQNGRYAREFARRTDGGMVGINIGIPVPVAQFSFSGHKQSFFGDLHCLGRDGVAFFTEAKYITSRWFDEEEKKTTKVGTWDGTITRS